MCGDPTGPLPYSVSSRSGVRRAFVVPAETARDRKRNRRMHEVVRNELQQIGIARGDERDFPSILPIDLVWRPFDCSIHSPRQAMHQSAELCMV
jgi:hypothetical protein